MTDNEIVKALYYCTCGIQFCSICPYCDKDDDCCREDLNKDALDLINRQKAEIERLQGHNENLKTANVALSNEIFEIKAEAVKEFADRLKAQKYQSSDWSHGEHPFVVEESDIDELVQEMVGDEGGTVY